MRQLALGKQPDNPNAPGNHQDGAHLRSHLVAELLVIIWIKPHVYVASRAPSQQTQAQPNKPCYQSLAGNLLRKTTKPRYFDALAQKVLHTMWPNRHLAKRDCGPAPRGVALRGDAWPNESPTPPDGQAVFGPSPSDVRGPCPSRITQHVFISAHRSGACSG